eukprot:6830624-Prymnesium_polylepis.1
MLVCTAHGHEAPLFRQEHEHMRSIVQLYVKCISPPRAGHRAPRAKAPWGRDRAILQKPNWPRQRAVARAPTPRTIRLDDVLRQLVSLQIGRSERWPTTLFRHSHLVLTGARVAPLSPLETKCGEGR